MDPFVTQLAELCRAEPTRTKWVLIPGHALGHMLGERLVLEGTEWANLRFTPPFELALEMSAPFLVERGFDPAPDTIGPALLMRLLLDLPSTVPEYFRHLADQPKMAEALWAAVSELRMAGHTAVTLPLEAFINANKHAELQSLLRAYEEHLACHRLADRADVYREATLHVDVCPVLPDDCRIELPGVAWAPIERAFLDKLPGRCLTPRTFHLAGLETPRRLPRLGSPVTAVMPVPASDAERLCFIMAPGGPAKQDGTLDMFRAGGSEAEIEEVFRRIAAIEIPLDQVEIACARAEQAQLIWEKAERYEWPVTVSMGTPITFTRPARALLALSAWVLGGFAAGTLRRMLQSGDLRVEIDGGPTAGQAARLLKRSDASWGRETYAAALTRLAAEEQGRAADPDCSEDARERYTARAAHAERLQQWITALLGLIPESEVPLSRWLDGTTTFIGSFAQKSSELDGEAAAVLGEALVELRTLADLTRPPREALAVIQSCLEGLTVAHDRARPGHLHATALTHVGYAGRPYTFVVGLEEQGVLPALIEDPVLLDRERERIDAALRLSTDRVSEVLHQIVSRLATLTGHVCLSFSCRDLREARASFPSGLLLQAVRLLKPEEEWTYERLDVALGDSVSSVPRCAAEALSSTGWWLANLRGSDSAAIRLVRDAFPALARGARAEAARDSDAFTEYDGLVVAARPLLDPRLSGQAVSPTGLEALAGCPFRYFLERGLGLRATEDAEPDPDVWLDPLTRGLLLHGLYATIMRELRARNEKPDPARHRAWVRELGEAALEAQRRLVPPPSEEVYAREAREVLNDLDLFLRFEAEERERTPVGFEVSFGSGPPDGEPMARPDPIVLDLGRGLRFALRGRIDRIDRLEDGTYDAVDYKTGMAFLPGGLEATFAGGRQLQHALYALAAAELLRRLDAHPRVVGSYYFPTSRGRRTRVIRPATSPRPVANVLRDLFDVIAAGAFVHTSDDDDCRFCDFDSACGGQSNERVTRKLANASNAALDPYRRLAAHE